MGRGSPPEAPIADAVACSGCCGSEFPALDMVAKAKRLDGSIVDSECDGRGFMPQLEKRYVSSCGEDIAGSNDMM